MPSGQVKAVLRGLFEERQAPECLRSDNGPEFTPRTLRAGSRSKGYAHSTSNRAVPACRQAGVAERVRGELQRDAAAGVPEPGVVPRRPRCEDEDRPVAAEVQSRAAAQRAGVPNAGGVPGRGASPASGTRSAFDAPACRADRPPKAGERSEEAGQDQRAESLLIGGTRLGGTPGLPWPGPVCYSLHRARRPQE